MIGPLQKEVVTAIWQAGRVVSTSYRQFCFRQHDAKCGGVAGRPTPASKSVQTPSPMLLVWSAVMSSTLAAKRLDTQSED